MSEDKNLSIIDRMIGAAKLDIATYDDVEKDTSATPQALMVVALVALATGIGTTGSGGIVGFILGIVAGIGLWALWAWITFFVGTTILKTEATHADWGQLARTLGFAQSPGVFKVFGFIPVLGPLIFFIASIWQLVTMITAIKHALDYTSVGRAIGVALIGFIPYVIVSGIIFALI